MINSMLIFSLIMIVIFYFAFSDIFEDSDSALLKNSKTMELLSAGILWIAFIFTGMLGLARSFISEKDKNCLEGLMLCPTSRNAIYLGKVISNLILIFLVEIATIVLFSLLNYNLSEHVLLLIPIVILGTISFVIIGALLSAISMNTRTGEGLLPLILFPILIPVILSAVTATGDVFNGATLSEVSNNLVFLGAFAVIFFVIALLTFEYVIEE
jgi:heme exporter protein B